MQSLEYNQQVQTVVIHEGTGYFIPWQTVQDLCRIIQAKMNAEGYYPARILCLGRGGMVPARLLAGDTLPVFFLGVKSYDENNQQADSNIYQELSAETWDLLDDPATLIVDDLWDTGQTLNDVYAQIPEAKAALLLSKKKPEDTSADFVGINIITDEWVVFPWERPL